MISYNWVITSTKCSSNGALSKSLSNLVFALSRSAMQHHTLVALLPWRARFSLQNKT